jgi:hypothetical protein
MYHYFCRFAPTPLNILLFREIVLLLRRAVRAGRPSRLIVFQKSVSLRSDPAKDSSLSQGCLAPASSRSGWTALAANRVSKSVSLRSDPAKDSSLSQGCLAPTSSRSGCLLRTGKLQKQAAIASYFFSGLQSASDLGLAFGALSKLHWPAGELIIGCSNIQKWLIFCVS